MDSNDAIELINKGGWELTGGRQYSARGHRKVVVTGAKSESDTLVIYTEEGDEICLSTERMEIEASKWPHASELRIKLPYYVRQQRKKVDGGGWHEAERIGMGVVFTNSEASAENGRLAEETRKREREEAKAEHCHGVNGYFQRQLELAGNGKVIDMKLEGYAAVITFENGHKLFFTSEGQGDGYCASVLVSDPTMLKPKDPLDEHRIELIFHS